MEAERDVNPAPVQVLGAGASGGEQREGGSAGHSVCLSPLAITSLSPCLPFFGTPQPWPCSRCEEVLPSRVSFKGASLKKWELRSRSRVPCPRGDSEPCGSEDEAGLGAAYGDPRPRTEGRWSPPYLYPWAGLYSWDAMHQKRRGDLLRAPFPGRQATGIRGHAPLSSGLLERGQCSLGFLSSHLPRRPGDIGSSST